MRGFLLFVSALALLAVPTYAQTAPNAPAEDGPNNVILMIPDGFGPASVTMARDYLRWRDGQTELPYDSLQVGSIRTYSADGRITDSAAGGTALASGTKTYNGAIGVDTTKGSVGTLLEGAERQGMATGLVVTSRLTHATPAAFSAHVPDRSQENTIAEQQLDQDIEVLLGGGKRHFVPASVPGSERSDDRNLLKEAERRGYSIVETADRLAEVDEGPLLGLFSRDHMAYEIDRPPTQPSLAQMTETAVDVLSDHEEGYFLMVEGSRIDHAGHTNDAAAHLHDILAFNDAVRTALDAARDSNTLVVIVSDHETGGLTLGRNRNGEGIYAWRPGELSDVETSSAALADSVRSIRESDAAPAKVRDDIEQTLARQTGVSDVSRQRLRRLREVEGTYAVGEAVSPVVNRKALVGWTSHAHTAVDVSLYAYGPGANRLVGNHDNTAIADHLADLMDVNLQFLTKQIREGTPSE